MFSDKRACDNELQIGVSLHRGCENTSQAWLTPVFFAPPRHGLRAGVARSRTGSACLPWPLWPTSSPRRVMSSHASGTSGCGSSGRSAWNWTRMAGWWGRPCLRTFIMSSPDISSSKSSSQSAHRGLRGEGAVVADPCVSCEAQLAFPCVDLSTGPV